VCGGEYLESDGGLLGFRIVTDGGGWWTARANCHDGYGFRTLKQVQALAQTGISRGEWERSSTLVTTNTDQHELKVRDPNDGSWGAWLEVLCWGDTLPGFKWNPYASDAWNIVSGSGC
jgi:hypothetical protein